MSGVDRVTLTGVGAQPVRGPDAMMLRAVQQAHQTSPAHVRMSAVGVAIGQLLEWIVQGEHDVVIARLDKINGAWMGRTADRTRTVHDLINDGIADHVRIVDIAARVEEFYTAEIRANATPLGLDEKAETYDAGLDQPDATVSRIGVDVTRQDAATLDWSESSDRHAALTELADELEEYEWTGSCLTQRQQGYAMGYEHAMRDAAQRINEVK